MTNENWVVEQIMELRKGIPHHTNHEKGGSDEVSLDATQITKGTISELILPKASGSSFGAVKIGTGINVTGGVISVAALSDIWSMDDNGKTTGHTYKDVSGRGTGYTTRTIIELPPNNTFQKDCKIGVSTSGGGTLYCIDKNGVVLSTTNVSTSKQICILAEGTNKVLLDFYVSTTTSTATVYEYTISKVTT